MPEVALREQAFEAGKETVIRNSINTEKFRFNPETRDRARWEPGIEDKIVIAHVCRFMPHNCYGRLIKTTLLEKRNRFVIGAKITPFRFRVKYRTETGFSELFKGYELRLGKKDSVSGLSVLVAK